MAGAVLKRAVTPYSARPPCRVSDRPAGASGGSRPGSGTPGQRSSACLACRADGADAGLRWLQAAAEEGLWYHERMLNDPDLAPLRGDPRFEPLLKLFRERWEAAQAVARPVLRTYEPESEPHGLLVALHGASSGFEQEEERARWTAATAAGWRPSGRCLRRRGATSGATSSSATETGCSRKSRSLRPP